MGWSFACNTRFKKAEQVAEFRRPDYWSPGYTVLADSVVGNNYWAAIQAPDGSKFVFLAMMKGGGRQMGWGHKDMTEHSGPYHHNCPLYLLAMTDEPTEGYAVDWRKRVREHHASKKARIPPAEGQYVRYGETTYQLLHPWAPRKGWRVMDVATGITYRMNARQLAQAQTITQEAA
jgi:hypothetical protein